MKLKLLLSSGLLGVLIIGKIGSSVAFAEPLPTNEIIVQQSTSQVNTKTTQENIASSALEKYFDLEIDNNIKAEITPFKTDDTANSYGKEYSQIDWNYGNSKYYVNICIDGQILDMGIIDTTKYSPDITLIDLNESKKIATDFITEKKLVDDTSKIEYLGEATIGPDASAVIYKMGEDKEAVLISVNSISKKVTAITYRNENDAKKSIEYSTFRENGLLG